MPIYDVNMSEDVAPEDFDPVVRLFAALANPIRAQIANRLTAGEASVGELSEIVGAKQPLVSHHLKVLRSAHLVAARKDGQKAMYSLTDDHVASIFLDAFNHMKETTMTVTTEHRPAETHKHTHGPGCGHEAVIHHDHVDYLHDGHVHHEHDGHYDECSTCQCGHCNDSCANCNCEDCACPTCQHAA